MYLEPHVNLTARASTRSKLTEIIQHFYPSYKPPPRFTKGVLIRDFDDKVKPIIAPYVEAKEESRERSMEAEEAGDTDMQDAPDLPDMSGLNPHSIAVTVDAILHIMKRFVPRIKLPATMSKENAIGFFRKYICPALRAATPFSVIPSPVPKPYHQYQTRDEMRFALQAHVPHIYVPLASCTHPILQALYEQFVLDNIAEGIEVFEGVDYYVLALQTTQ
jgi:hypothetical protein